MVEVFEFEDYKDFLNAKLDELNLGGRGSRTRLSRAIGCQTAYTAQVLRGTSQFSLEQGEGINEFLGHTDEQGHYFLLLIQFSRAGTAKLRGRFKKQIEEIKSGRALLKNRLEPRESLGGNDQQAYYSSWVYGALHALSSIPDFQRPEVMSSRLGVSRRITGEALEFLLRSGVLEKDNDGALRTGKAQIHLGADSLMIAKHHTNWRLQAIRNFERGSEGSLHYSSVISISKKDEHLIREKLISMITELKPIIKKSKEEEALALCFDFFRI